MRARTLDRYIGAEFIRLFLLFVLSTPMMFIIMDVVDNLDRYLERGLTTGRVALSYVYQFPLFVLYAFPIASLIATIFTVNRLARHSEIAAAKAGGVSFYRLMTPLVLLGIVLTVAAMGLSELVPITNRKHAVVLGQKAPYRPARTDFVYRADDGRVFSIRRLDVESGHIFGVAMEREGDEPRVPSMHLVAQQARYEPRTRDWTFEKGFLRLFAGVGVERTYGFQELKLASFRETPDQLLAEPKDPEEMRYRELGEFIDVLQRSGGKPLELMTERAQKISVPFATLIVVLFGAPLAMRSSHRGGMAYGVGVSLGITIVYLMLFRITGAAGAAGTLPPLLAGWLPNIVFAAAAGVLLARVRT